MKLLSLIAAAATMYENSPKNPVSASSLDPSLPLTAQQPKLKKDLTLTQQQPRRHVGSLHHKTHIDKNDKIIHCEINNNDKGNNTYNITPLHLHRLDQYFLHTHRRYRQDDYDIRSGPDPDHDHHDEL